MSHFVAIGFGTSNGAGFDTRDFEGIPRWTDEQVVGRLCLAKRENYSTPTIEIRMSSYIWCPAGEGFGGVFWNSADLDAIFFVEFELEG